jgi:hypothetical protein
MSDHDFEKKVQQKMDDLRLRPSDAVWAEVDRNLRRDKRRRRIVLWLPLMGILLTAGGYFIFTNPGTAGKESLAKTAPAQKTAAPATSPVKESKETATAPRPATETVAKSNSEIKPDTKPVVEPSTTVLSSSKNTHQPSSQNSTPLNNKPGRHTVKNKTYETPVVPDKQANRIPKQKPSANRNNREPNTTSSDKKLTNNKPAEDKPKVKEEAPKTVVDSNAIVSYNNTVDNSLDSSAKAITQLDSAKKQSTPPPAIVKAKTPAKKKQPSYSKWQWGVKANAGVANISEGSLFNVLRAVRVYDLTGAGPSYNGIPPVPTPQPSAISPGAAFTVGAFVQRNLSKRFGISAGLQYSYFSVKTQVGKRVDSALAVNYGNYYSQVTSNYYRADNKMSDYVNRYHFIELPVTASYRVINSKKFPVLLDIGMSLSRLMNTTALHFDGITGVYYENDDFFKQMQYSLNGALSLGLFQNSKHPLWVGPNLRYFTTGLIKKEVKAMGDEQHIWFFGLNAKMLLKK